MLLQKVKGWDRFLLIFHGPDLIGNSSASCSNTKQCNIKCLLLQTHAVTGQYNTLLNLKAMHVPYYIDSIYDIFNHVIFFFSSILGSHSLREPIRTLLQIEWLIRTKLNLNCSPLISTVSLKNNQDSFHTLFFSGTFWSADYRNKKIYESKATINKTGTKIN